MRTTNFLSDNRGIFYTAVVVIIILFVTDITYLVVAYTGATFFDVWGEVAVGNIYTLQLESTLRFVGPIVVVILNVGLLILLVVSAWKRQSVESPSEELLL